MGVSPRRLHGWEPRTVTERTYDADGRVSQTVTYQEPEFNDDDLALLLERASWERQIAPHGQPLSEATSSENDRRNRQGSGYYSARLVTDFAQEAIDSAREALEGKAPHGAFWVVDHHTR